MLKAFGSCGEVFQVPACGRRIPTLMALLSDLWEGAGGDPYSRVFPGSKDGLAEIVPRDFGRAEELIPYRSLDPPFLSDPLWMAYMEPRSLLWTGDLRSSAVPDVSREDPKAVADLVPIWDAKGLLYLKDRPLAGGGSDLAMRFFNCYKSLEVDRMIGDRRACNYVEGRLTLVSPGLPAAHCLFDLEVSLPGNRLSICCADRKDFYHQFRVSEQRAVSNACYPLIDIKKTSAFQAWCLRNLKRKKYDRLLHGDRLGEIQIEAKKNQEGLPPSVQICFNSIPQGDHLGVEFATPPQKSRVVRPRGDEVWRGLYWPRPCSRACD